MEYSYLCAPMRVLIVSTSDCNGGAAVAANRLTEALINNGVKARMLVCKKESDALYVATAGTRSANYRHFLWERGVIWLKNRFNRKNLFKVSIANSGTDITKTREFQEADIVHLHWVNQGYLSLKGIQKILMSGKPVVWTMHDMWELTAICHHAYDCNRFESECCQCPFLQHPAERDLSYQVFQQKKRLYAEARRLTFVAVGEWLAARARASALTGGFPIKVIPNSISLSQFTLIDRTDARTALDVQEPYVLSFGAARIDDPIKGFSHLLKALQLLQGQFRSHEVRVLLFGGIRDASLLEQIPFRWTHLGYVGDEHQLSAIYSASNATVSSSLYETFGQTLVEAQACGSLPVAFAGSGPNDIIVHRQTGFLADYLSAESLAEGMAWALRANVSPRDLRRSVMRRFGESVVANRYIELYHSLSNSQV